MIDPRLHPTAPPAVYRQRRAQLAKALTRPVVLMAGFARSRNYPDNHHPFRPGSHYVYFGGHKAEGAAWLIEPGSDGNHGSTLLREAPGVDDQVWLGEPIADEQIAAAAGINIQQLAEPTKLPALLGNRTTGVAVGACLRSQAWASSMKLGQLTEQEMQAIIQLRMFKDEHEIAALRRAGDIAADGHMAAIQATRPGAKENDLAAAFLSTLMAQGAEPSFNMIATVRGDVLHPSGYYRELRDGQLVLMDAGAEEPGCYASDITRTYPVSGRFTPMQRALCDVVQRAHDEAIAACRAGARFRDIHDKAAVIICEGLVDTGILKGKADSLAERRAHTLFFTHGLGHLVGLDVHDMEDFGDLAGYVPGRTRRAGFGDKFLRLDRDLAPGMVVTIEPGLYFVEAIWRQQDMVQPFADAVNMPVIEELLRQPFGGIRIEDTVLVTAGQPEVLTGKLTCDLDDICAVINS